MKDALTPILVLALCGTLAFVYFGRDKRCAFGTPALSANTMNYINSRVAGMSKNVAKPDSGQSLSQATDRVLKLNKAVFTLAGNAEGYFGVKNLIPEGTFDLDDVPTSEKERRDATFELYERITSKIRRTCREGG